MGPLSLAQRIKTLGSASPSMPTQPLVCYGHSPADVISIVQSQAQRLAIDANREIAHVDAPLNLDLSRLHVALIDCSKLDTHIGLTEWTRVALSMQPSQGPLIAVFTRADALSAADKLLATRMAFDAPGNTQCVFASSASSLSDLLDGLREALPCSLLSRVIFCAPEGSGSERELIQFLALLSKTLGPQPEKQIKAAPIGLGFLSIAKVQASTEAAR
jgi:hypothetical protein